MRMILSTYSSVPLEFSIANIAHPSFDTTRGDMRDIGTLIFCFAGEWSLFQFIVAARRRQPCDCAQIAELLEFATSVTAMCQNRRDLRHAKRMACFPGQDVDSWMKHTREAYLSQHYGQARTRYNLISSNCYMSRDYTSAHMLISQMMREGSKIPELSGVDIFDRAMIRCLFEQIGSLEIILTHIRKLRAWRAGSSITFCSVIRIAINSHMAMTPDVIFQFVKWSFGPRAWFGLHTVLTCMQDMGVQLPTKSEICEAIGQHATAADAQHIVDMCAGSWS